jgi:hypothetical protein
MFDAAALSVTVPRQQDSDQFVSASRYRASLEQPRLSNVGIFAGAAFGLFCANAGFNGFADTVRVCQSGALGAAMPLALLAAIIDFATVERGSFSPGLMTDGFNPPF